MSDRGYASQAAEDCGLCGDMHPLEDFAWFVLEGLAVGIGWLIWLSVSTVIVVAVAFASAWIGGPV